MSDRETSQDIWEELSMLAADTISQINSNIIYLCDNCNEDMGEDGGIVYRTASDDKMAVILTKEDDLTVMDEEGKTHELGEENIYTLLDVLEQTEERIASHR